MKYGHELERGEHKEIHKTGASMFVLFLLDKIQELITGSRNTAYRHHYNCLDWELK